MHLRLSENGMGAAQVFLKSPARRARNHSCRGSQEHTGVLTECAALGLRPGEAGSLVLLRRTGERLALPTDRAVKRIRQGGGRWRSRLKRTPYSLQPCHSVRAAGGLRPRRDSRRSSRRNSRLPQPSARCGNHPPQRRPRVPCLRGMLHSEPADWSAGRECSESGLPPHARVASPRKLIDCLSLTYGSGFTGVPGQRAASFGSFS